MSVCLRGSVRSIQIEMITQRHFLAAFVLISSFFHWSVSAMLNFRAPYTRYEFLFRESRCTRSAPTQYCWLFFRIPFLRSLGNNNIRYINRLGWKRELCSPVGDESWRQTYRFLIFQQSFWPVLANLNFPSNE